MRDKLLWIGLTLKEPGSTKSLALVGFRFNITMVDTAAEDLEGILIKVKVEGLFLSINQLALQIMTLYVLMR